MSKTLKQEIEKTGELENDFDDLDLSNSKKLFNHRFTQDTSQRKWLSIWTTFVVSIWLFIVILILCFNNLLNLQLSDTVLSVLLSTTTLNILGLSLIVLRGLFGNKE